MCACDDTQKPVACYDGTVATEGGCHRGRLQEGQSANYGLEVRQLVERGEVQSERWAAATPSDDQVRATIPGAGVPLQEHRGVRGGEYKGSPMFVIPVQSLESSGQNRGGKEASSKGWNFENGWARWRRKRAGGRCGGAA